MKAVTDHVIEKTTNFLKEKLLQDPFGANIKNCMLCKTAFSTIDSVV
jgi:hypothetical protein